MEERFYPCERCGGNLIIGFNQGAGMTGENVGKCTSCGKAYPEMDLEMVQANVLADLVPVVDTLQAARILGRPGEGTWASHELRRTGIVNDCGGFDYPLTEVRAYAERHGIRLVPLDDNTPSVWIKTAWMKAR
jgi:hypothetical protein